MCRVDCCPVNDRRGLRGLEIPRRDVFPNGSQQDQRRNPRRWLLLANPAPARVITEAIGYAWITDLDELRGLAVLTGDAALRGRFLRRFQRFPLWLGWRRSCR